MYWFHFFQELVLPCDTSFHPSETKGMVGLVSTTRSLEVQIAFAFPLPTWYQPTKKHCLIVTEGFIGEAKHVLVIYFIFFFFFSRVFSKLKTLENCSNFWCNIVQFILQSVGVMRTSAVSELKIVQKRVVGCGWWLGKKHQHKKQAPLYIEWEVKRAGKSSSFMN